MLYYLNFFKIFITYVMSYLIIYDRKDLYFIYFVQIYQLIVP